MRRVTKAPAATAPAPIVIDLVNDGEEVEEEKEEYPPPGIGTRRTPNKALSNKMALEMQSTPLSSAQAGGLSEARRTRLVQL